MYMHVSSAYIHSYQPYEKQIKTGAVVSCNLMTLVIWQRRIYIRAGIGDYIPYCFAVYDYTSMTLIAYS